MSAPAALTSFWIVACVTQRNPLRRASSITCAKRCISTLGAVSAPGLAGSASSGGHLRRFFWGHFLTFRFGQSSPASFRSFAYGPCHHVRLTLAAGPAWWAIL